jgi:murein DD-endopeptidase MepM/ murein hydrolase activator NlpD
MMLRLCGALFGILLAAGPLAAQSLYKYRGPDGEWIYADRPSDNASIDEVRTLGTTAAATVSVSSESTGAGVRFVGRNPLHVPVELELRFNELEGFEYPDPDRPLVWLLAPQSRVNLLDLAKLGNGSVPTARYQFDYRFGDPDAQHNAAGPYRVPVAVSSQYPVTQAYPEVVTHTTEDSRYAVDIAMPIGTDIFAARDGVVFDVSADNFRSGLDPDRDGPAANVVQILHDDGTYAVYAHLNWNSIRVRPGDRVARGQYIADSGNTGFSSGPHLHFVVLRNSGRRTVSVPVVFEGADRSTVQPATGGLLTAY